MLQKKNKQLFLQWPHVPKYNGPLAIIIDELAKISDNRHAAGLYMNNYAMVRVKIKGTLVVYAMCSPAQSAHCMFTQMTTHNNYYTTTSLGYLPRTPAVYSPQYKPIRL